MLIIVILAILQGLTEFLPVSSSGHLVLLGEILEARVDVSLELWLHLATVGSLILYFGKDLARLALGLVGPSSQEAQESQRLLFLILLTTVVTGAVGLGGKSFIEVSYLDPRITLMGFLITALVLILTAFRTREVKTTLFWQDAIWVGLAQSLALFPGISRSGMTAACLLFLGYRPETAFRYSFLILFPLVIIGAILEIPAGFFHEYGWRESLTGFGVACVTGLVSLHIVKRALVLHRFHWFGVYCALLAAVGWLGLGRTS